MTSAQITKHDELENKYAAEGIRPQAFCAWAFGQFTGPTRYLQCTGPDVYYGQGRSVVRHRVGDDGGPGELTVKRRRSRKSIEDRQEVDLTFAAGINILDVQTFLEAAGFKRILTLIKHCHIFWFEDVSVVLYNVWRLGVPPRRLDERWFLEVEVEKGSGMSRESAAQELLLWRTRIARDFPIGEPLNESLFELYTGRKYSLTNGGDDAGGKRVAHRIQQGSRRAVPR